MQAGNLIYGLLMQDSSEGNVSLKFASWEVWNFLLCFSLFCFKPLIFQKIICTENLNPSPLTCGWSLLDPWLTRIAHSFWIKLTDTGTQMTFASVRLGDWPSFANHILFSRIIWEFYSSAMTDCFCCVLKIENSTIGLQSIQKCREQMLDLTATA